MHNTIFVSHISFVKSIKNIMTGVASYVVSYSLNTRPIVTLINANYVFNSSYTNNVHPFRIGCNLLWNPILVL